MNAELLLAHYESIADAPHAIARLRRFILDLAVRGKLLPQNPMDEPATELLKRIVSKRLKMAEAGIVRPAKILPASRQAKRLFSIPLGWAWTHANELWDFENGDRSKNYPSRDQLVEQGIPFVNAGHLVDGQVSLKDMNFITPAKFEQLGGGKLRRGDQLYCLRGSLGKHAIFLHDGDAAIASSLVILRPIESQLVSYLSKYLDSDIALSMLKRFDNGTAQPNLSSANLRLYEIPLPPLAEQQRIVAKVDELMALCDQLESARTKREAARDRLAAASLVRLNAPDPATFQDDARFALDALKSLTARPNQIKQLRQTILNLAVRGKLVPQDPKDEPASLPVAVCEALPEEIPTTWRYTRLVNLLAEDTRNGYSRKPDDAPEGTPILRISAGTIRQDGVVAEEEHKLISGINSDARLQYGLKTGDLLACRFNGNKVFVGRFTIFNDYLGIQPIYPDKLIRVRAMPRLVVPAFLQIAGDTDFVRSEVEAACATTVGNWGISASNLKEIRFPLPPLAEQRRIVAKVNELMALCDRLEASLDDAAVTRRRLLDALLAEALEPGATQEEAA
jgi:type I restriction enzyme S subunit